MSVPQAGFGMMPRLNKQAKAAPQKMNPADALGYFQRQMAKHDGR